MEMVGMDEESSGRRLVITGELIGKGRAGNGCFEENGSVFSKFVGLAESKGDIHFVTPLSGVYNPKRGDGVVGKVVEIIAQKWFVDINSPYEAVLTLGEATEEFIDLAKSDLTKYFDYNDLIFAEILSVNKQRQIMLSMRSRKARKLRGGRLISVTSSKVPRIIGKGGSMVEMIKQLTGTQIVVGQNGIVWVKGENEDLAAEAILKIEERAHTHGLTEHIKRLLEERSGRKYEAKPAGEFQFRREEEERESGEFQFKRPEDEGSFSSQGNNY
jgi:exosome complex component RRP4